MENIGDWLYLVIIIIAAISSIIGSINKKSKQAAGKPQPREIIAEDWEGRDFRNDHRPETRQPVFREKQPVFSPHLQAQQTTNPRSGRISKKTGKDVSTYTQEMSDTLLNTEEDHVAISLGDMPQNTDEWRKAFLYNEIFKRKG